MSDSDADTQQLAASAGGKAAHGAGSDAEPEMLPPSPEPLGNPGPDRDRGVIGRNIVLFSDGTGNSSAKIQKTNVWRLYEALDLGYPVGNEGQCVQLAYYDNGVGTSAFRLFAALGGVFGFGLARNIRDIYKFLCRNYQKGDRIYAFGFSRGAYTIRLLVSLVAAVGIVANRSEEQLDRDARDMWREYRRGFHTNNFGTDLLVAIGRAVDRLWLRAGRIETWRHGFDLLLKYLKLRDRKGKSRGVRYADCVNDERRLPWWGREWWEYWRPQFHRWVPWLVRDGEPAKVLPECGVAIDFVGVWDTVAAYGGPMVEITRAIDEWIWPLTMPDYRLSEKVAVARHALAIDDKRDAFQPLLWDEVQEKPGDPDHPRLQQVWFAGMHSDVGGGYADETLAYVSLWWMVEHAQAAAGPVGDAADALRLRLLPEPENRFKTFRNVYGPIHNSRGGGGAFYRYQPRYIKAWLDWDSELDAGERADAQRSEADDLHVAPATQAFRDPTIDRGRYRRHGLLKSPIRLHLSVEERLRTGTDRYAPNNLPVRYVVDDGVHGVHEPAAHNLPPQGLLDELGDRIKLRRFWYFISIVIALALVAKPIWPSLPLLYRLSGTIDARTDAQIVETAVNAFLPEFAERWTHALAADPWVTIGFLMALAGAMARGNAHEWRMTDVAALMWKYRFATEGAPEPVAAEPGLIRMITSALRRSSRLQAVLAYWKWRIVPFATGLLLWLALWYAAFAGVTQLALVRLEQSPSLCSVNQTVPLLLPIDRPCNDTGRWIDADRSYVIEIEMVDKEGRPVTTWEDGAQAATPQGWSFANSAAVGASSPRPATGHLRSLAFEASSVFLRRVVTAPLMAPVLELRDRPRTGLLQWFLGDPVHIIRPELTRSNQPSEQNVWTGHFRTPTNRKGRLYFFVNDAVLPFDCAGPEGTCWTEPRRWRVLSIPGRYRNNRGYARLSIEPEPDPKM